MGSLQYGDGASIPIDDWTLRHLQAVIFTKLQRGESFALHLDARPYEVGPESVWIGPGTAIAFRYATSRPHPLDREWLLRLYATLDEDGLRIVPEDPRVDAAVPSAPDSTSIPDSSRYRPPVAPDPGDSSRRR